MIEMKICYSLEPYKEFTSLLALCRAMDLDDNNKLLSLTLPSTVTEPFGEETRDFASPVVHTALTVRARAFECEWMNHGGA
jgi:hypothetical protein